MDIVGAGALDGPAVQCNDFASDFGEYELHSAGARCVAQRIKISMIAGGNHTIIQVGAAPYSICEHPAKLEFDYGNAVTELSERVTIIAAPGTHCLWGHPHKLKFGSFTGKGTAGMAVLS